MFVALLAFLFQALIPPGYMVAAPAPGAAPAIAICTGHGPLRLADPSDRHSPTDKQKSSSVCPFAGHGAPPIPALSPRPVAIDWSIITPAGAVRRPQVSIGRSLAAPPPARGPPSVLA